MNAARHTRRAFLRNAGLATAGLALAPSAIATPHVLTPRRTRISTEQGTLRFVPHYVQRGVGPHIRWAYASDQNWDAFRSNIEATEEQGVFISDADGVQRFGINTRWNVEGFGFIFITADNGGELYELPPPGQTRELNLNFELARSRVMRNRRRLAKHQADGWQPSREVRAFLDISDDLYEDAVRVRGDELRRASIAQDALRNAMRASELMELDNARFAISRRGTRDDFFMGCDARSFYQMDPDAFMEGFTEIFDYATITHYLTIGHLGVPDFEPTEGDKRFDTRDALFRRLRRQDITVQGRPLYYAYESVTPDWLREKSYDELLRYVERHTREVVGHYGDGMYAWEVVNELHDWANQNRLSPEQTVELTKLACDVAKDTAPNVHRLINNCCPFAEYVQLGTWGNLEATYPQRTPWQFMRDLVDAGVDFTITGQQMYFPHRDLQDIIMLLERFEQFGRPVHLTEVGATSGPSNASVKLGSLTIPDDPYVWHRHWDEELQADWLEAVYTLAYSKPWIEAANWYDYEDAYAWIQNGGLVRSRQGEKKAAFHRLMRVQKEWGWTP
ncbi:MAG: endo-1,4-beta-xylanase [Bacteroidota bacterium]